MIFRIIHEKQLHADTFTRTPAGVCALARVICDVGLRPEQGVLNDVAPLGSNLKVELKARHNGSGVDPATGRTFENSILVSVAVRSDSQSLSVIEKYLGLLVRYLAALPDNENEIANVLHDVEVWAQELAYREW